MFVWLEAFKTDQKFRSLNGESPLLSGEMGICQLFLEGSQKSDLSLRTSHASSQFEWTKVAHWGKTKTLCGSCSFVQLLDFCHFVHFCQDRRKILSQVHGRFFCHLHTAGWAMFQTDGQCYNVTYIYGIHIMDGCTMLLIWNSTTWMGRNVILVVLLWYSIMEQLRIKSPLVVFVNLVKRNCIKVFCLVLFFSRVRLNIWLKNALAAQKQYWNVPPCQNQLTARR